MANKSKYVIGLLANLWEFPSVTSDCDCSKSELVSAQEKSKSILLVQKINNRIKYVTDVFHQFSHISQTYAVYDCGADRCEDANVLIPETYQGFKWSTQNEIAAAAISTAMKKVSRAFSQNGAFLLKRKGKSDGDRPQMVKKQRTVRSFFQAKTP